MNKNLIIALVIILIILVVGIYYFTQFVTKQETPTNEQKQENKNNEVSENQGIKIEILKEGEGESAESGNTISVNYVGMLEDGTVFDSSVERGVPFTFTLGINSVIQGWEVGVVGIKKGETRKLTIPPQLAYGQQGVSGVIPPNSTLIFEITLIEIND
jgi:peptidylprolyl isomerase/FKBP-type peptidyl-prolyl cis-trans isomerase FkpA